MRDAFGGAFMIKLLLVFIFIYICFTAVALNYAKAFKVKNKIIDYMETWEIIDIDSITASQMEEFSKYINEEIVGNMKYNMSNYNVCEGYYGKDYTGKEIGICHPAGIIIEESGYYNKSGNIEGVYYTVHTYLGWSLGFLNALTALDGDNNEPGIVTGTWRISGETRVLVRK